MRNRTTGVGLACLVWAGAARAEPCADFRTLALMPSATVAAHEGGADPSWFNDSQKLSDLTLMGAPCTIGLLGGTVANVDCPLDLKPGAALDPFFDAVNECLKDKATKISRDAGRRDYIWTAGGAMVKMVGMGGARVNVRFVY